MAANDDTFPELDNEWLRKTLVADEANATANMSWKAQVDVPIIVDTLATQTPDLLGSSSSRYDTPSSLFSPASNINAEPEKGKGKGKGKAAAVDHTFHLGPWADYVAVRKTDDVRSQQANVRTRIRCGTTTSPEWRRDQDGRKTLCNACGLQRSRQEKLENQASKSKQPATLSDAMVSQRMITQLDVAGVISDQRRDLQKAMAEYDKAEVTGRRKRKKQ